MKNMYNKIVYQIYPLSFCDSNNDGIGDINGIISKLPYLKKLGVDYIWISPLTESPMKDNGYDVQNYYTIDKKFGTNQDYYNLIKKASTLGMKIIMDIVLNHTSDKNKWFKKSIKNIKPYDSYYIWRDKPNPAFLSQFENNSWTYNKYRKQYYLHHFSKFQPDLNWENDDVLKESIKILNFWIEKGVSGFRLDVIDMIGKQIDKGQTINIPRAFKLIKKIGEKTWLKNKNIFTVGECWSTNRTQLLKYVNSKNGLFDMAFASKHMFAGWNDSRWDIQPLKGCIFIKFKNYIFETQQILEKKVITPLFIENHDFSRSISRLFNSDGFLEKKAKVVATTFYGFAGTMFIYQGQEIGMSNSWFNNIKQFNDPETKKFLANAIGNKRDILLRANNGTRDNARIVMQWNDKKYSGFSKSKPWLDVEKNDINANVESQLKNRSSVLSFYKKIINFRKKNAYFFEHAILQPYKINNEKLFSYKRILDGREIIFLANWSNKFVDINLSNYKTIFGTKKIGPYDIFIGEIIIHQNKGKV